MTLAALTAVLVRLFAIWSFIVTVAMVGRISMGVSGHRVEVSLFAMGVLLLVSMVLWV